MQNPEKLPAVYPMYIHAFLLLPFAILPLVTASRHSGNRLAGEPEVTYSVPEFMRNLWAFMRNLWASFSTLL
jgi:hypothetical protein